MKPNVTLHAGDCRERMKELPDNSIDAILTDKPYELTSIRKRFGAADAAPAQTEGNDGAFGRLSKGFLGMAWDGSGVAFDPVLWSEMLRVLKPGGYYFGFMGARTYHRAACAAEDAGFLIHPMIGWVYGQGMSLAPEMAKMIDKHLGTPGEVVPSGAPVKRLLTGAEQHARGTWIKDNGREYQPGEYVPGSPEAAQWAGWRPGAHARKTALEPIIVAQKPFSEKSAAANLLKWGVGALNIDACRTDAGRHPSNLMHDGSPEVVALFPESAGQQASSLPPGGGNGKAPRGDSGSAARYFNTFEPEDLPAAFYHPKAGKGDRDGSSHATVKPIGLLRHLVRHICPPGGTILDPFAGSGTTAVAAQLEGMNCILMEAEDEYIEFLRKRFKQLNNTGDNPRLTEIRKNLDPRDQLGDLW